MSTAPGIGAEFAGYRVERLLGRGGVGLVYLAQDLHLPRHVALKILSADVAGDERFRERFVRESRMAASIDHHNIVPIYQAGEVEGVLYIAMRYVAGTDLRTLLASEGHLDPERTLSVIGQVASALDVAHAQGLVHRDVKPGNILIVPRASHDATDHAYLADFGITKRMSTDVTLTVAGQFVGTADYVAPEQIMGGVVDGRADIYSLACVLYQCLSGTPPFDRDSDVAVMYAHLSDPRPLLSDKRLELPGAIDEVLATAMAKNPGERYPTALAFVAAARGALLGMPQREHREPDTVPGNTAVGPSAAPTVAVERPTNLPGADATQAWSTAPAAAAEPATRTEVMLAPPPPLAPAAPWSGAPSALPSRPGTLPARGMLIAVAIVLVAAGGALAVVLSHRGGSSPPPPSGPSATGVSAMLLTADDFPVSSVLSLTQQLRLADVRCGAAPAAETEEKQVAFQGQGGASGLDYFDATASFATNADARAYMDQVDAAQRACKTRLSPDRAAPQLGDRAVRVLFPSNDNTFTYDAVYINKGRYVSLVLVAASGTAPPPAAEAEKYAPVALRHMTDNGA